jgi:hypothetical protein
MDKLAISAIEFSDGVDAEVKRIEINYLQKIHDILINKNRKL